MIAPVLLGVINIVIVKRPLVASLSGSRIKSCQHHAWIPLEFCPFNYGRCCCWCCWLCCYRNQAIECKNIIAIILSYEVLHITSRFRSRLQLPTIKVDNSSPIVPSDKVKILGVIFDRHMVMDRFVSLTCKSASFQLHRFWKIRQYLDTTTAKKLVQALVLCYLDYCNSLFYNIPDSQLGKIQIIQNSAARLITGTKKYSPITPVLQQLHWLPVKSRISFKLLLLTFTYKNC